jgi:hypothetical protein
VRGRCTVSAATAGDRLCGFVSSGLEAAIAGAAARRLRCESVQAGRIGGSRAERWHGPSVSKFSSRNSDNGLGEPMQERFNVLPPERIASLNGRARTLQ